MRFIVVAKPLALLAFFVVSLQPALAAPPSPVGRSNPAAVRDWMARLESAELALMGAEYKRARQRLDGVLDEMARRLEGGEGAGSLLGAAAAFRAIAEAGLGHADDSAWDWSMAESLFPGVESIDLSLYGAAGEALAAWVSPELPQKPGASAEEFGSRLTPPRRVKSPVPRYPLAVRHACLEAPVIVETRLGSDGKLRRPVLLSQQYPVLGFAAMDQLRKWRFEPAAVDGKSVEILLNTTFNFGLDSCDNPFALRKAD